MFRLAANSLGLQPTGLAIRLRRIHVPITSSVSFLPRSDISYRGEEVGYEPIPLKNAGSIPFVIVELGMRSSGPMLALR